MFSNIVKIAYGVGFGVFELTELFVLSCQLAKVEVGCISGNLF